MKRILISLLGATIAFGALGTSTYANGNSIESEVSEVIGTPYKYGGTTTAGFDCSGFILHIMDNYKLDLPRTSQTQAKTGSYVEKEDLRAGDLVFFNTNGRGISHAGIYIGENKFAHSSTSKGVTISSLSEGYYKDRYVTARRVLSNSMFEKVTKEIHK
ncbi:C40 family peptidase [Paenibacillus typhae]|uniref:Cell wall-associated hydrolase, NlpC family n=1 Tax=Paenibacillus typhae TaxID=1174501 RepID=A0A1G8F9X0_9BACL|nr:C40 family peptidase [Paenibacillus typhae]SDH78892.1 Cell wall-associated hydrolase, NlpC family [Paenibacillus typhae]